MASAPEVASDPEVADGEKAYPVFAAGPNGKEVGSDPSTGDANSKSYIESILVPLSIAAMLALYTRPSATQYLTPSDAKASLRATPGASSRTTKEDRTRLPGLGAPIRRLKHRTGDPSPDVPDVPDEPFLQSEGPVDRFLTSLYKTHV